MATQKQLGAGIMENCAGRADGRPATLAEIDG